MAVRAALVKQCGFGWRCCEGYELCICYASTESCSWYGRHTCAYARTVSTSCPSSVFQAVVLNLVLVLQQARLLKKAAQCVIMSLATTELKFQAVNLHK